MAVNMLSTPAYTEEMAQQGQYSTERPLQAGGSLFNPNQLSTPVDTVDDQALQAFMQQNGISDIVQGRAAYYNQQQQPQIGFGEPGMLGGPPLNQQQQQPMIGFGEPGMLGGPALQPPMVGYDPISGLGGSPIQQQPTPGQQLNTPSLTDIAQTQPFAPPNPYGSMTPGQALGGEFTMPMTTQPPETQQLVQQLQAPTTEVPTTPVPVLNQPPATQQLVRQIAAPTAPRPVPNNVTKQFAQQFKPVAKPAPRPAPRPVVRPPQPVRAAVTKPVAARPAARSVSKVNPPLMTRPTGRR